MNLQKNRREILDTVFPGHKFSICPLPMIIRYLTFYACSDTEISVDPQVPFLPSVEVLVKALVLISSAALAADPSSSVRVIFCSHHPCVVGTAKRDAVWRVNVLFINFFCSSFKIADPKM